MGTMVRINEDNYVAIKKLADQDDRSVTSMTNRLLDKALGRSTIGVVGEYTTPVQKTEAPKPEVMPPSVADLLRNGDLKAGSTVAYTGKPSEPDFSANELECCEHPTRPCKHWVWDADSGEGYKNVLSGRFREAD
jgi:hypothetical protein